METTEAFADELLTHRLAASPLGSADRGLTTRLVYGTLAWQGRLDHHLGTLLRSSLAGFEPPVRAALRLGLYQLMFLERVPAYAAVDSSVRLARGGIHDLLPVLPVAILEHDRDRGADRLTMTHTGENVSGIALDLHAAAPAIPLLAAPELAIHKFLIYGQASGQPREKRDQRLAMGLSGSEVAQHGDMAL